MDNFVSAVYEHAPNYDVVKWRSSVPRADQNDPDKIGRIFGVELCHDARAMRLDGSLADAEMTSGFLIGGSSDYLAQHLLFPLRQWRIDQKLVSWDTAISSNCILAVAANSAGPGWMSNKRFQLRLHLLWTVAANCGLD